MVTGTRTVAVASGGMIMMGSVIVAREGMARFRFMVTARAVRSHAWELPGGELGHLPPPESYHTVRDRSTVVWAGRNCVRGQGEGANLAATAVGRYAANAPGRSSWLPPPIQRSSFSTP